MDPAATAEVQCFCGKRWNPMSLRTKTVPDLTLIPLCSAPLPLGHHLHFQSLVTTFLREASQRRDICFGWKFLSGDDMAANSCGAGRSCSACSHLAEHRKLHLEAGLGYPAPRLASKDFQQPCHLPQGFYNLPRECHQLETKSSNTRACGDILCLSLAMGFKEERKKGRR